MFSRSTALTALLVGTASPEAARAYLIPRALESIRMAKISRVIDARDEMARQLTKAAAYRRVLADRLGIRSTHDIGESLLTLHTTR